MVTLKCFPLKWGVVLLSVFVHLLVLLLRLLRGPKVSLFFSYLFSLLEGWKGF